MKATTTVPAGEPAARDGGGSLRDGAEIRRLARAEGLMPAISRLHGAVLGDALPCGPGGHAVVPAELADGCPSLWAGGAVVPRDREKETVLHTLEVPEGGTVVALRCEGSARGETHPRWVLGLAWLRWGLSERLLDACLEYLGSRSAGDAKLLHQQMVKGRVADALIEHLEIGAMLDGPQPPGPEPLGASALAHLHEQITAADRMLLRLLGASSFLAAGPGQTARISELIADVYTGPARDGGEDA